MIKRVIIAPKLIKFPSGGFATGMAIFPFILLKNKEASSNVQLLNHESIHLKQQLEMLVLPFYIWYGLEYLVRRVQFNGHYEAYRHISFEREAYSNDQHLNYSKERSFWAFLNYLK